MAAILPLLLSLQPDVPQLCDENDQKRWCFTTKLLDQITLKDDGAAFFQPFLYDYDHLLIIYALNCSLIAKKIQSSSTIDTKDKVFEAHLKNALALANIFHIIHSQYLHSPQECQRIEKEEVILRLLLREYGYKFELIRNFDLTEQDDAAHKSHSQPVSKWFREQTASVNWPRLLIVRVKRVLDAMVPILKGLPNFVNAIKLIDEIANPVFAYLSWVFYVPRFTLNFFLLLKNVMPHFWMTVRQKKLGLHLRFKLQFGDKWFELGNDGVWLAVGLVNCFIFVGNLAPLAIYLTVALYAFDVVLAAIRAYVGMNKLHKLKKQLLELSNDPLYSKQVISYLNELDQNIQYESKRLGLSLLTTIGLLGGMLFSIPAFASSPFVSLLGAAFIVVLCICTFVASKHIEKQKTSMSLPLLADNKLLEKESVERSKKLVRSPSAFFGSNAPQKFSHKMSEDDGIDGDESDLDGSNDQHVAKPTANKKMPTHVQWRFHHATMPVRRNGKPQSTLATGKVA